MKPRISMLAFSLALGVVMAQTTPPTQDPQTQPKSTKTESTKTDKADKQTATEKSSSMPAEMKTMTFKGMLVDMACASRNASSSPKTPADSTKPADAANSESSANRMSTDSGATCAVTESSKEFGLKTDDGKTLRFDIVGNQRAMDAMKNEKSWSKDISANKPIKVKISGVMNGDRLIVASIH